MRLQRISIVFDKSRFRKLADAVQEAESQIGHYGYNTVEILSESGKCLKIVRRCKGWEEEIERTPGENRQIGRRQ